MTIMPVFRSKHSQKQRHSLYNTSDQQLPLLEKWDPVPRSFVYPSFSPPDEDEDDEDEDDPDDEDDLPPLVEPPPSPEPDLLPPLFHGPPPGLKLPPFSQRLYFLPPLDDPPSPIPPESQLFPETEPAEPAITKPSHHKKRPADHIPRPPNAFILFRASFIKAQHIPGTIEPNNNTISRIIGLCWKSLPEEERQIWKAKARQAMEEHKKQYPSYRYNPRDQQNRTVSAGRAKRKVKEISGPPADPERCQEIARMLVEGKKGGALEIAVKQLDQLARENSPDKNDQTMQARFDAPMTEKTFRRRSSSVPPASTSEQDKVASMSSLAPKAKQKRVTRKRSSSTGERLLPANSLPQAKIEKVESYLSTLDVPEDALNFGYYARSAYAKLDSAERAIAGSTTYASPHQTRFGPMSSTHIVSMHSGLGLPSTATPSPPYLHPGPPDSPVTPIMTTFSPVLPPPPSPEALSLLGTEFIPQSTSMAAFGSPTMAPATSRSAAKRTSYPSSTFSSLEGWDGFSAYPGERLDAAGSAPNNIGRVMQSNHSPLIRPISNVHHPTSPTTPQRSPGRSDLSGHHWGYDNSGYGEIIEDGRMDAFSNVSSPGSPVVPHFGGFLQDLDLSIGLGPFIMGHSEFKMKNSHGRIPRVMDVPI